MMLKNKFKLYNRGFGNFYILNRLIYLIKICKLKFVVVVDFYVVKIMSRI